MTIPTGQETTTSVDKINKAHGHTLDGEGLLNNYAIEPKMYHEDGTAPAELGNRVTIVDIFPSKLEAKNAVLEMEQKGLRSQQISILAKNYQNHKNFINWETIATRGGLTTVLTQLGISEQATTKFTTAIEEGKFLVIAIGSDREASQVEHVLEEAGHSFIETDHKDQAPNQIQHVLENIGHSVIDFEKTL